MTSEPVPDPRAGEIYVAGRGTNGAFTGGIVWRIDAAGTIVGVVTLSGYTGSRYGEMNNPGQVTSFAKTQDGSTQATLEDGLTGISQFLGTLGGTKSLGFGINDSGKVVGRSNNLAGSYRGFVWSPASPNGTQGTMVALGTLGGTYSSANGISNLNQIVGDAYLKGDKTLHACLWQNGATTPTDLNSLKTAGATGLELLEAYRINNQGAIIGCFYERARRTFLLTPR